MGKKKVDDVKSTEQEATLIYASEDSIVPHTPPLEGSIHNTVAPLSE